MEFNECWYIIVLLLIWIGRMSKGPKVKWIEVVTYKCEHDCVAKLAQSLFEESSIYDISPETTDEQNQMMEMRVSVMKDCLEMAQNLHSQSARALPEGNNAQT